MHRGGGELDSSDDATKKLWSMGRNMEALKHSIPMEIIYHFLVGIQLHVVGVPQMLDM
jgi:hypothetical protein